MVLFSATAQVVWTFANNTKYRPMIKQFVIEGDQSFYFYCLLMLICKCKKFMLTRGSFLNYYYHCCYYFYYYYYYYYYYYFCIGERGSGPLTGAVSFGSVDILGCAERCCQSH